MNVGYVYSVRPGDLNAGCLTPLSYYRIHFQIGRLS